MKRRIIFLMLISLLASLTSGYLLALHYNPELSSFCDISSNFDCDIVNKSQYSTIDGFFNWLFPDIFLFIPVPNAFLSLFIFLAVLLGGSIVSHSRFSHLSQNFFKLTGIIMFISLLYASWLVYIEAFVLRTWCLFCILLYILILSAFVLCVYKNDA